MATIIDGKAIAEQIRSEIKQEVETVRAANKDVAAPGLAVIIVGTRKDSQTYVRLKHKAAEECGFHSIQIELPEDVTQDTLHQKIEQLNADANVNGILVQLPLPKHINEADALDLIDPKKDVDGLHPTNVGFLHTRGKTPYFLPCTPMGVITMLKRTGITISGKRAVVIGRSNIVGLPVSQMLLQENATVTICHSKTENPEAVVKEADIIVAACGQAELVKGSWVKKGAAIIDVGTNPVDDPSKKTGYRLVGDVNFEEAKEVAGAISPVPGGVGPMTIASLLSNCLNGWKRSLGKAE